MPGITDDMQGLARRLVEPLRAWFLSYGSGYTAGAWVPTFAGTGTAGTFTYTAQSGRYVRIGNLVWITGYLAISAIAVAPTGNLTVTGLPWASRTSVSQLAPLALGQYKLDLTAGKLPGAYIGATSAVITLVETQDATAVAFLPAGALQADSNMIVGGCYETD